MKKTFITLCILALGAIGVFAYLQHSKTVKIVPTTETYRKTDTGFVFTYPKILLVTTNDGTVMIHHDVPFIHHHYCDFKGEDNTAVPTLTDFNISLHLDASNIITAMKTESPYIPAENFVNNTVVVSPGFIDSATFGKLSGYKIFEGAEGCGHMIYFFSAGDNKTLVVIQDIITIFSGAIDPTQAQEALQVPGIISKNNENKIFNSIISSLSIN